MPSASVVSPQAPVSDQRLGCPLSEMVETVGPFSSWGVNRSDRPQFSFHGGQRSLLLVRRHCWRHGCASGLGLGCRPSHSPASPPAPALRPLASGIDPAAGQLMTNNQDAAATAGFIVGATLAEC